MIREGYQQTVIGLIPCDWDVKSIGEFTTATAGGTPSTLKAEYWDGSIRWMNSGELNLKKVFEVEGRITEEGLVNSSTKIIPPNCVLVGLAGQGKTRGTVAINMISLCTNQSIAAIFPNKSFCHLFLYYTLDSKYEELRSLSTGDGGRGGLNLSIIKNIKIVFPSLPEQKAIAEVLGDVDRLINACDKLIAKKRDIKQGAMQELLTGRSRLPGFTGEWEVKKLGEIINYTKGFPFKSKDYQKDGVRIIRVSDTTYDSIKEDNQIYIDENKKELYSNWELKENDLVISTVGSKPPMYDSMVGKVIFINKKYQGSLLNQNAVLIRVKDKNFDKQKIIYFNLKSQKYLYHIESIYRGNANQASINLDDLFSFTIPLPPLEEQKAIAQILSDMDSEVEALEKKRDKYKLIKQGMMQELLTGKTRLL